MSEEKIIEENTTPQTADTGNESKIDVTPEVHQDSPEEVKEKPVTTQIKENTYLNDTVPTRRFFGSRKEDANLLRDKMILSKISDKDLLEYLKLEKERMELLQHAKEARAKRILSAFEVALSLISVVAAVYFLKDEPTILMSILYICGILVALWLWKKPHDK
ncbi:MAG: hypothetical protein IJZ53_07810 [Tyzzerella sp.]|nr:hypothetical protein [Tyzzerella sp.]